MVYDAFRKDGGPTMYPPNKTPVQADILESGFAFCIVILAFSFFIILPGFQGKEKLYTFIRVSFSLFVGVVILVSNFSQAWEVSDIETETQYKAGARKGVHADIGVHIGLRGVNITLKGVPEQQLNETINFNEHFSWEWGQGRIGFGPFAGRINQEYRAAQFKGLPYPILWIAEYFTLDGEGIRWGRHYRTAGWYCHIMLWLSFATWLMANILFFVLLRYGAYLLAITGGCMLLANIIFATLRNPLDLEIPFTDEKILKFHFGWGFWLCLITGLISVIVAILIFVMTVVWHNAVVTFFGADPLEEFEEEIEIGETMSDPKPEPTDPPTPGANGSADNPEFRPKSVQFADADDYEEPMDNVVDMSHIEERPRYVKRRSNLLSVRFAKSRRQPRRPPPLPPVQPDNEDDDLYINVGFHGSNEGEQDHEDIAMQVR